MRAGHAIGTFGRMHLAMSQLIGSMPESALVALKEECDALTTTNCSWFDYRAAQWIKPELQRQLAAVEQAKKREAGLSAVQKEDA